MISVTILTKNAERTLEKTLQSVRFFQDVVILDTGSQDRTLEIAQRFPNVHIHSSPFEGFGPLHNRAASLAQHDWIFSLDSDEVLSAGLVEEILNLKVDPTHVYAIKRHNYLNQKLIKGGAGWRSDWVVRLYNRNHTKFSDHLVHEKVLTDRLNVKRLQHPIEHTPYLEISDFLSKMQHYTSLYAEQSTLSSPSFFKIVLHSWFAFFKSYILKGGFLAGKEGYIISAYNAHTTLYKYLKLNERKD